MKVNTLMIFSFLGFCCFSVESKPVPTIIFNKEVQHCLDSFPGKSVECLSDLKDASEEAVDNAFHKKEAELTQFDYNKWRTGTDEQKKDMISGFRKSQKSWEDYKMQYCQVISTGAEDTNGYSSILLSCVVNMNKQRIKDIEMITPDISPK